MANPFSLTHRSLRADRGLASAWLLLSGIVLSVLWLVWAFFAQVTGYEVSDFARLEVAGAASPVEANVAGDLAISHLVLGQAVQAGDILIQLDDHDQQLALQQEETRRAELSQQSAALHQEVEAQTAGQVDDQQVLAYSTGGAKAQLRQAQAEAELAGQEAKRAHELRSQGLISEADFERATTAAESERASAEALQQSELRLAPELTVRNTDRLARQRQILTDIAKLQGTMADARTTIERRRYEIEKRKVRAPVSGKLTECAVLHPGAHIAEGQRLGIILPAGKVDIVADFSPAAAFGIVHTGQPATIRLQGFPWARFGVLNATVARVAGDIRDGKVRVELALKSDRAAVPLQHGLPATVEVEVERVTPAAMLLRSAGQSLGGR